MQEEQLQTVEPDIEYRVSYSRRRTMGISISPEGGVVVRVPYRTPDFIVRNIIRDKSFWIKKVLKKHSSLYVIDKGVRFESGAQLLFMGRYITLKLTSSEKSFINYHHDIIGIGTDNIHDPLKVQELLEQWYKREAQKTMTELFSSVLLKYGNYNFRPTGFAVRKMKKRWGSCTYRGNIAISYDLVRLNPVFAEYVIIHELCHLVHHNHSREYYKLLTEVFPQWKDIRTELKKYIR